MTACRKCQCCGPIVIVGVSCIRGTDTVVSNISWYYGSDNLLQRATDTINFYQARGFVCAESLGAGMPSTYCGSVSIKAVKAEGMLCGDWQECVQ
jgi:hypothetical protein